MEARAQASAKKKHAQDFSIITTFLKIQAVIEIFNSVRNVGTNMLASASDTEFAFKLNVAALFVLMGILSLVSTFIFKMEATIENK